MWFTVLQCSMLVLMHNGIVVEARPCRTHFIVLICLVHEHNGIVRFIPIYRAKYKYIAPSILFPSALFYSTNPQVPKEASKTITSNPSNANNHPRSRSLTVKTTHKGSLKYRPNQYSRWSRILILTWSRRLILTWS
jgi:hypothetical protein